MELQYFHLPMIYYGAVHRSVIDEIISIQGSLFANTTSLDMYSGMCISYTQKEFYISDFPFCISGASSKSNGNLLTGKKIDKTNKLANEFLKLSKVEEAYELTKVPKLFSAIETTTWVNMELFKQNFKIPESELPINIVKAFLKLNNKKAIQENYFLNQNIVEAFKNSGIDFSESENLKLFYNTPTYFSNAYYSVEFNSDRDIIDPVLFGIHNVYDAACFCEKLRKNSLENIPITLEKDLLNDYKIRELKKQIKYHIVFSLKSIKDFLFNK
jgi:hypothetical protein